MLHMRCSVQLTTGRFSRKASLATHPERKNDKI